jgi:hypothetical protein
MVSKALFLLSLLIAADFVKAADISLNDGTTYKNARIWDVTPTGRVLLWSKATGSLAVFYNDLTKEGKREVKAYFAAIEEQKVNERAAAAKSAATADKLRKERIGTAKTYVIQTVWGRTYESVLDWEIEPSGIVRFNHAGGVARHKLEDLISSSRDLVTKKASP